jgi:ABC-type glycerol-3-phosphate transport system permease component
MAYKGHRINPQKFEKSQVKIIAAITPLVVFTALPLVFIVNHAFKPMEELFAFPPNFLVRNPTLDNFTFLMKITRSTGIPMSRYVFNSVIVTFLTIFLSLLFTTCAAFALSKIKFRGKNLVMDINQAAIMFVATAVLIPRYLIISMGGMIDTYVGHIFPLVAMPVALFLVKQFTDQVPDSLMEAAYIDGASDFQVYRKIILPMIKPAIATASILVFQAVWNNLETSNYFMNDDSMKTLTFYMNTFATENNTVAGQGAAAASALIMFIPNIVLFVILQKNVMNTMAHSGIK